MFFQPRILTSSSYIKSHVSLSHIKTRHDYDLFFIFSFRDFKNIYIFRQDANVYFLKCYIRTSECL